MRQGARSAAVLVVVVLMVVGTMLAAVAAEAQVRQGPSGRLVARGLSATMSGELESVDGSGAWGRLVVEDLDGEAVLSVEGEVFDLEPLEAYSLVLDGMQVLELQTDSFGDAVFSGVMTSDTNVHGSYGAALVPGVARAGDLWQAEILDQDLSGVLEARLSPAAVQPGNAGGSLIEHQERISLVSAAGSGPVGMARVERRADGAQLFETVITGLESGLTYGVVVDGLLVARVQADSGGAAAVRLKAPDAGGPDNELPPALQPVDDLRAVQWTDAAGTLVASGAFTGFGSRPVNLLGTVQMVGDASFVVVPRNGGPEVTVLVGDATRWGGELTGIADLEPDLQVLVRGDLQADGSVMAWLVAGGQAVPPDQVLLNGTVESVGDGSFVLVPGDAAGAPVTVQVDDATVWRGDLTGLADLLAGDLVHVSGTPIDGGGVLARCVAGLQEPPDQPLLVTGAVDIIGAESFVLLRDDGPEPVTVRVGDQTRWRGSLTGLDDLVPGMMVLVQGERVDGELEAAVVTDRQQPAPPARVLGTVDAVGADGFTVDDGQGALVGVAVDDQTHWAGVVTGLDQLEPGMWVHVEGELQDDGSILAVHVMARTEPPSPQVTLVGVVDSIGDAGFDVAVDPAPGAATVVEIVVDDQTHWAGSLSSFGELEPGMVVLVEGVASSSGVVLARLVVGEPHPPALVLLSGVVDSVSPGGFVVVDQSQPVEVVVDDGTIWGGALTGLGDVVPGLNVHVEGVAQDDGTVLARFVGSRPDLPVPVVVAGAVDTVGPTGFMLVEAQGVVVEVVVDDATLWRNPLTGLADLAPGMQVVVQGIEQDDGSVLAHVVADQSQQPRPVTLVGLVDLVSPTGFLVAHQNAPVEVVVDDATVWGGSLSGLADVQVGMRVVVEGVMQGGGIVLAHMVADEPSQPLPVILTGVVESVGATGFVLHDHGVAIHVAVNDATLWDGSLSGLTDLEPGVRVVVEGERQGDGTVLAHLVIGQPNQPGLVTVDGIVGSVSPDGFTVVALGMVVRVVVSPHTQWVGAAGLADLAPGMRVVVEGERQPAGVVNALLVRVPPIGG